jgi:DNA-binding transcriptional ArsR family regulator
VIATAVHGEKAPPPFLRLAGHPLRWRLLSELARSDRRVGELCALASRRQSLVSYHLRQLRDGGLVSMRRSTADGRDTYYALDLARCSELLSSAGASLHPALAPLERSRPGRGGRRSSPPEASCEAAGNVGFWRSEVLTRRRRTLVRRIWEPR